MLFSDQPINSESFDELGLAPFTVRLSRVLLDWPTDDSLVLGLFGPWGSGKTSALNLLSERLAAPEFEDRALVVRFNPWLYRDTPSLLQSFFSTLRTATKTSPLLNDQQKKTLGTALDAISKFAVPVFAPMTQVFTGGVNVVTPAANALMRATQAVLAGGEVSLETQKARAAEVLGSLSDRRNPKRIVVLVDDLDRADRDEVVAMLKTVKLIASLPNITYVLALDYQRIQRVLSSGATPFEASYLEKIIQVPITLPAPDVDTVRRLTMGALEQVMKDAGHPKKLSVEEHNRGIELKRHLFWRVRTLRDRARLVNSFRFLFLSGDRPLDVDPVDAVLISFVHVFFPSVSERLRRNKAFLTGQETSGQIFRRITMKSEQLEDYQRRMFMFIVEGGGKSAPPPESDAKWGDAAREDIDLTDADGENLDDYSKTRLRGLVSILFPHVVRGEIKSHSTLVEERRDNRIASPERFDRYFAIGQAFQGPSDADVLSWINTTGTVLSQINPTTGAEWLEAAREVTASLDESTRTAKADFFERVLDAISNVDPATAERVGLAIAFGATGGAIEEDRAADMIRRLLAELSIGGQIVVTRRYGVPAVYRLGETMEQLLHFAFAQLIADADDSLDAVAAAGEHVNLWGRRAEEADGPSRSANEILEAHGLDAVVEAGLRRMNSVVASGMSPFSRSANVGGRAVWRWRDLLRWSGADFISIRRYLQTAVNSDLQVLPDVLTLFAGWSDRGPSLDHQSLADIRRGAEEVIGWRFLLRAVVRYERKPRLGDSTPYAYLVDEFVDKVRQRRPPDRV